MESRSDDFLLQELWECPEVLNGRLCELLGIPDGPHSLEIRERIERAARTYIRWRKQEKATAPLKAQRRALEDLADSGHSFGAGALNTHAEFLLYCEYAEWEDDADRVLVPDRERIRAAARAALSKFPPVRGPHARVSSYHLAGDLCRVYEVATGRPATHTPRQKMEYTGRPNSTAGRFVEFVMKIIDPELTRSQICTAVRYAVKSLKTDACS